MFWFLFQTWKILRFFNNIVPYLFFLKFISWSLSQLATSYYFNRKVYLAINICSIWFRICHFALSMCGKLVDRSTLTVFKFLKTLLMCIPNVKKMPQQYIIPKVSSLNSIISLSVYVTISNKSTLAIYFDIFFLTLSSRGWRKYSFVFWGRYGTTELTIYVSLPWLTATRENTVHCRNWDCHSGTSSNHHFKRLNN